MKTIKTAADFSMLSEDDKDAVFSFDSARTRLKYKIVNAFMLSGLLIIGSMLFMVFTLSIDGMQYFLWIGFVGGAFGFMSIPVFTANIKTHYQAMRWTKQLLAERGIDASEIKSEAIWESLENNAKQKKDDA